jgi:hypothetical protein
LDAAALPRAPTAQISVPNINSGFRLVRSPAYAHATDANALTRYVAAVAALTAASATPKDDAIGLYSGGTSPIATLSSEASTMNTTTV